MPSSPTWSTTSTCNCAPVRACSCSACVRSALRVSADSAWAVSTTGSSSAGPATAAIAIIGNRHSSNSPTVAQVRLTARSPLMRPAPARSAHAMPAAVRPTG
ncbi:hypothetical protein G6F32_015283 [Rhizopus arrhizus]|nr:hypothetical protein G6F32_015283 [Rhizopus arrhizus]